MSLVFLVHFVVNRFNTKHTKNTKGTRRKPLRSEAHPHNFATGGLD